MSKKQLVALGVFVVSLLLMVWCTQHVSHGYFQSADETQYMMQAERFVQGKLYSPYPRCSRSDCFWFIEPHSYADKDRVASKYPPGFSAMLALGIMAGHVDWVNPLFAALGLTLFYCILLQFVGSIWSLAATALLALNPIYWGYGQSYFPHTMMNTLTLAIIWLVLEPRRKWSNTGLAAAIAVMVLTRITDALCVAVALAVYARIVRNADFMRPLVSGFIAGVCMLLLYHWQLSGKPALSLYGQGDLTIVGLLKGEYNFFRYSAWYINGLERRTFHLLYAWYFRYSGYIYPLLGVIGLCFARNSLGRLAPMLVLLCVCILGLYSFLPYMGYPFFGIRYQSFIVIALGAFVILPFYRASRYVHPVVIGITIACYFAWQLFVANQHFEGHAKRYKHTENLYTEVAEECPDNTIAVMGYHDINRHYFTEFDIHRNYHEDIPVVGAPVLRQSGKRIDVTMYPINKKEAETRTASNGRHFCFPEFLSRQKIANEMKWTQPYFLIQFPGDRRNTPKDPPFN